ncbi:unnamed protein product, partial [Musa acuminata subsp. burmannicoides]
TERDEGGSIREMQAKVEKEMGTVRGDEMPDRHYHKACPVHQGAFYCRV